jgi:hypothetical protein
VAQYISIPSDAVNTSRIKKFWDIPFFSEYPPKCDKYATVSYVYYKVSGSDVVLRWF